MCMVYSVLTNVNDVTHHSSKHQNLKEVSTILKYLPQDTCPDWNWQLKEVLVRLRETMLYAEEIWYHKDHTRGKLRSQHTCTLMHAHTHKLLLGGGRAALHLLSLALPLPWSDQKATHASVRWGSGGWASRRTAHIHSWPSLTSDTR